MKRLRLASAAWLAAVLVISAGLAAGCGTRDDGSSP
jgi:hypothetical protein